MWYRNKREEETPARAAGSAPLQEQKEAIPISTTPARAGDFGSVRAGALIGKSLEITGEIRGAEDLVIDGRMKGDIELPDHRLTIGPTGVLHGKVRAREIVIYGTVQGNLEATERVEIKKNARVIGDLKAQRPVIEDEAFFKGNVETIRPEPPKAAGEASRAAAAPQPPAPQKAPAGEAAAAEPARAPSAATRQESRKG